MKNTQALPADVPMNGIINPQKTVIDMGYFFSFRYLVAMRVIFNYTDANAFNPRARIASQVGIGMPGCAWR
jgi:hypothetical protein